ncbi:hypothetical protein EP7_002509 [Isosphaeraceae bacterium EP7]
MLAPPALFLGLWIVVTVVLFWRLDVRTASLIAVIGGWAILPNSEYPQSALENGRELFGPVHGMAIPAPPPLNKATAIGLGCLAGILLFHCPTRRPGSPSGLRPRWFDLPMIAWCAIPLASSLANGRPPAEGLSQVRHLILAWGVPYAVGRLAFAGAPAMLQFCRAWVVAGLAYLPFCAVEFVTGPVWYHLAYGGHVYRYDGAPRRVGHRPLVLLEHGNQLGIWMATAAVASCWLWATGHRKPLRIGRLTIPALTVPVALAAACLACQSHASIALMLLALLPLAVRGRLGHAGKGLVLGGVGLVGLAVLGALAWVAINAGGDPRQAARSLFHGLGKSSFTWRLARIQEQFPTLAAHPLLGRGVADWSGLTPDGTFLDPIAVSLWVLAAGMYGALGLATVAVALHLPLAGAAARLRRLAWDGPQWGGVSAAVAVLAVSVADLAMNSGLLLPVLIAAGGLTSWAFGPAHVQAEPRSTLNDNQARLARTLSWLSPESLAQGGRPPGN